MAKHSKDQGRAASKPKQKTKKSERTSHGLTAQPSSDDDQGHGFDTIEHSEARPVHQEQIDEGAQDFDAYSMMVDDKSIEVDFAPTPHGWRSDEANLHLEAAEQVLQGPVDGPLSANDFANDRNIFYHAGAHVSIPTHFDTRSTGYTLPQSSWEAPATTPQTLSIPSSYNASTAATAYQSTYDPSIQADYSHPTTTALDALPMTTKYQLERWVYENRDDELTDRMEGHNYNLSTKTFQYLNTDH